MYSLHVCVSVCLWVCVCWERVLSAVDIKVSLLKREPLQSSVRRLALGCMESSNVAWALKHPLFTYSHSHTHAHTRTHTRHLTNGARYKMLGNLFMCMCVSTWLYMTLRVYYRKVSEGRTVWFPSEGSPELCRTARWWRPGRIWRCWSDRMSWWRPTDEVFQLHPR